MWSISCGSIEACLDAVLDSHIQGEIHNWGPLENIVVVMLKYSKRKISNHNGYAFKVNLIISGERRMQIKV
jgi:hypothetical protein